jgi:hypothetical protein
MLEHHHFYAQFYKHAYVIVQEHGGIPDISIKLCVDATKDRQCYNLPASDEIAAVILVPGDNTQVHDSHNIVIQSCNKHPIHISKVHPSYHPLYYVLLFLYGEDGWSWDFCLTKPDIPNPCKLLQRAFYAFQLHNCNIRKYSALLGGQLFQEFVVDTYASVDQEKLQWIEFNQHVL